MYRCPESLKSTKDETNHTATKYAFCDFLSLSLIHNKIPLSLPYIATIMSRSVKVAVIGAGVSGLVAARELQREGHKVVVFEKNHRIGGTWAYDPRIDSDPLGIDPTREVIHSSLYLSMRTNLPRQLMGYLDYPFVKLQSGDPRTFPGHDEVLRFLGRFADEFGVVQLTRFDSEVVRVEKEEDGWVVEWRSRGSDSLTREMFEAVVVCTGHNTVPKLGKIEGIENWKRYQIHSHNYRVPDPFEGQVSQTLNNTEY